MALARNAVITVTVYGDADLDGMNDLWELNFGNLDRSGSADLDGDGKSRTRFHRVCGWYQSHRCGSGACHQRSGECGLLMASGTAINLQATATDVEDGNPSLAIGWASNLQGALGNGSSLNMVLLPGDHTVTATVTGQRRSHAVTAGFDPVGRG